MDWQSFLRDDTNIGNTRPLIRNTDPVDLLSDSEEDEVVSPGIERSRTALVQQSISKKSLVGNPTKHHEIRAEPLSDKAARSTTSSRERHESREEEVERPHKRIRPDDERPSPSTSKAQPKTSKPHGRFAIDPRRPVFEQQGLKDIQSRIHSQLGSRTSGSGPAGWVENPPRAIPIRSPSIASIDRGSPSIQTPRPNQLTAEVRRDSTPTSRTNPVVPQANDPLQTIQGGTKQPSKPPIWKPRSSSSNHTASSHVDRIKPVKSKAVKSRDKHNVPLDDANAEIVQDLSRDHPESKPRSISDFIQKSVQRATEERKVGIGSAIARQPEAKNLQQSIGKARVRSHTPSAQSNQDSRLKEQNRVKATQPTVTTKESETIPTTIRNGAGVSRGAQQSRGEPSGAEQISSAANLGIVSAAVRTTEPVKDVTRADANEATRSHREPEKRHFQSVAQEAPARRSIRETRASGSTIKQALLPDLETTPRKRNLRTKTQQQTATLSMKNQWQTKYKNHPFLRQLELMKIPIDMTNEVDTEPPPDNFRFIPENRFSEGTMKPDVDALYGCSCTNCTASCSCVAERNVVLQPNGQSWGLPYKLPKKKLAKPYLLSDLAIHECNIKCSCPPECRNRNVQSGGNVSLQIFKTEHRGWGLRSHDVIAEGEFVDTYRGEILTEREAQRRGRDETRKNVYFFNLDKFSDEIPAGERGYVIDGESMGSPARFINHSCDPNLKVFAVSLIRGNPRVYKLAFFAIRDIAPMEELTFDYQAGLDSGDTTSQNENKNSTRCLCEAENCRDRFW